MYVNSFWEYSLPKFSSFVTLSRNFLFRKPEIEASSVFNLPRNSNGVNYDRRKGLPGFLLPFYLCCEITKFKIPEKIIIVNTY